ncbi:MAG: DNA mismatch repair endonuclease MutL [Prevotella sp.]|nr:DNA mismatch repair endonuclease MutL [Prevotella sp.]
MDLIHLLPDTVANQIAAGEVIQRPASVIKELVENAIDAGAKSIRVIVVDAGRTSIQVIDDGHGMSETDARLAFERHATSKIQQADDLFALHTMGFRGEALPSIAAVAQVELTSRTADDEVGTRVCIAASKVVSQEPVSCPVGCNFKVDSLFYNVPARRKFLKSNATELNNILVAFERMVLVYPEISFTLHSRTTQGGALSSSGGNELLNLRAGTLMQRIADVFGKTFSQELMPLEVNTAMGRVSGFVGKPEAAKKKGAHQYFFVNGRYMRHPYFHKAVVSAYDRLIPEGMQPPYFIYFDVAPADIDVNIHPTKTEIKFENEQPLWQILLAAVKDAIGRFCDVPTIDFDTVGRPDIPVFNPSQEGVSSVRPPRVSYNRSYNPFKSPLPSDSLPSAPLPLGSPSGPLPSGSLCGGVAAASAAPVAAAPVASPAPLSPSEKSPVHYQYKGRYIMTAVKSGLMIVDQYRASLRILFEKYLAQTADRTMVPQAVLFPEVVQFSQAEAAILASALPLLSQMGFELTDLGGGSYVINAIPTGVDGDPVSLVRSIVADVTEDGVSPLTTQHEKFALSLARATAVPYGQLLSNDEMDSLTNQLFACSNVNYTPDGHPVLTILPQTDIDRLFG